jgi:hypothetical protein
MTGLWMLSYVALWVLFLIVAVLLVSVLYHLGNIYNKIEKKLPAPTKLTIGENLPQVDVQTMDGRLMSLSQFQGAKTAFAIISPGCYTCFNMLKRMANGDDSLKFPVDQTVIISLADRSATEEMTRLAHLPETYSVFLDTSKKLKDAWGINTTPVIVEADEKLQFLNQRAIISY